MKGSNLPIRMRALIALAALAGCAEPPPPPPPSPTATIDGRYTGSANGSCGSAPTAATVREGRLTLTIGNGSPIDGIAHRDGSLTATAIDRTGREMNFTGHIDDRDLRGGSYNGRCAFAFSMTREASGQTNPIDRTR